MAKKPVTYQLDKELIEKIKNVAYIQKKAAQVLVNEILTKNVK